MMLSKDSARRTYQSQKVSGLDLPKEIPSTWRVLRVRDLAKVINGYPFDSELFHASKGMPLIRIRDINRTETEAFYIGRPIDAALVKTGDVIIGMDGDFNVARWSGPPALLNQRLCLLRSSSDYIERFLAYALPTHLKRINDLTYSTTVKHLSSFQVQKVRIPMPPEDEVERILLFLDDESAKADALIAKYERLIELLEEKRFALITHAVTKGLDTNARMKDSGTEWIGRIPQHWHVEKTKFVAKLKSGHTPSRNRSEYWLNCNIPWVTLADVGRLRDGRSQYVEDTKEQISELGLANSAAELLPAGTVIVSRTASVGYSAIISKPMATTQDFVNWVCGRRIVPEYLLAVFRAMKPEFARLTNGSVHQTIYMPDVNNFVTPVPPLNEQRRIGDHVQRESNKIFNAIDAIRTAIRLLRERRAAIVNDAVTGKIKVRTYKPKDLEEVVV